MPRTGIQQKRRRYVHKQEQNASSAYGGGGSAQRTGGINRRADNALKKTQGYDALNSEHREKRGRKTGSTTKRTMTGGAKARARGANRKQKARG